MLDLVRRWNGCATHAARFGGDPGNVTIFGQSGGGGKVCALLGHAAAPRACSTRPSCRAAPSVRFAERERTTQLADAVLKQLGLGADQLDALQALPVAELCEAIAPAQKTLPRPRYPLLDRYNFGPVIDGKVLPAHPFDPAATAMSDDIPMMVGGTKDEIGDLPRARRRGVEPHADRGRSAQAHRARSPAARTDRMLAYYACCEPGAPTPADRLHHGD